MSLRFKIGPAVIAIVVDTFPRDWPHPFYGPFEDAENERPGLRVRVLTDPPPAREKDQVIGELAKDWQLYPHNGGLRLEILEQIQFQPRLVALINPAWDQVDAHLVPLPYRLPGVDETGWSLGSLMEPLVQWWLTAWLAHRQEGIILHGSAVSLAGHGLAFIGPSGAGKTTVARWCRDEARATVLSDERIVVWHDGRAWQVGGTPWYGELHEVSPLTRPLGGLFVLSKAATNRFVPWKSGPLLSRVIPEAFLPIWSPEGMDGLVEVSTRLVQEVPSGELQCVNDPSVVSYLEQLIARPSRGITAVGVA